MCRFAIRLKDKLEVEDNETFALGEIIIGSFSENFQASISYWRIDRYKSQWKQALKRLIEGSSMTALITSMYDPQLANFIFWWVFYRVEETVYIQNHVLFMDDIEGTFNEKLIYDYIPKRETVNEDGDRISEWKTDLKSIKTFLGSFA
jgi:hypothetical protein